MNTDPGTFNRVIRGIIQIYFVLKVGWLVVGCI